MCVIVTSIAKCSISLFINSDVSVFTIEDAEKDFLQICDFNYLRDKENTEEKEENSVWKKAIIEMVMKQ